MNHFRAKRRLSALLDGGLSEAEETEVRRHVSRCRRCARRLADFELTDALLQRVPLSVAPLEFDPTAHARLARLALWTDDPAPPRRERWTAPALGVAGLVLAFSLALSVQSFAPLMEPSRSFDLAMMPQETVAMSVGWRPGR